MEREPKSNIEKELDEIDKLIIARSKTVEDLKCRRYELMAELDDLDIHEAVECAIENGISPKRLIDLIVEESRSGGHDRER